MTTFIDFRYTACLASARFTGHEKEEATIIFTPGKDNYLAFEITLETLPKDLFSFIGTDGKREAVVSAGADGSLCLAGRGGKILLRTPLPPAEVNPPAVRGGAGRQILVVRLGSGISGFKLDGTVYESTLPVVPEKTSELRLYIEDESAVRVMGRGTGRAARGEGPHGVQSNGLRAFDQSGSAAATTLFVNTAGQGRAQSLASHFDDAELTYAQNFRMGPIVFHGFP